MAHLKYQNQVFDAMGIQPESMICAPVRGPSGGVFAVVLMVNKFCWRGGGSKAGPRSKGLVEMYGSVFDCLPNSRMMGNVVDFPSKQVNQDSKPRFPVDRE